MSASTQRFAGWVCVIVFALLALLMFSVGWIRSGWVVPDMQCIDGPKPEQGGPFYESTRIEGRRTYFPLGVDCSYDVEGDAYGPQTVHNYNAAPTVVLVLSVLGIVAGMLLITRARLLERVRGL
jgi:hypothetical protein